MNPLPDEALVIRGGANWPESLLKAPGVSLVQGKLRGVSVSSALGKSIAELTAPDDERGYLGIPHKQLGVTTVGQIRASGGDVSPSPTRRNPDHATLSGLTPDQASELFRPTTPNPNRLP